MKRGETTNTFQDGLVMDFNPMITPNTMLTNALNATLLTYNGNENVLQNDMGNGRVETAYLPEGFIPVGTTSFGGIVYIASYNPLTKQSQIGSFPSPERNILSTELPDTSKAIISKSNFYKDNQSITYPRYKLILFDKELSPGDKFQIFSNQIKDLAPYLSGLYKDNTVFDKYPKYLKLHVVSVDSYGKINYLDNDLVWYSSEDNSNLGGSYYIRNSKIPEQVDDTDLDEYRDLVTANYSVFTAPSKGKLGILAELECITSFSISYKAKVDQLDQFDEGDFDSKAILTFYVNWTYENSENSNLINLNGFKITWDDSNNYNINDENKFESKVILDNSDTNIETHYNDSGFDDVEFKNKSVLRQNDGVDEDYEAQDKLTIKYNSEISNNLLSLEVVPYMPFGYLDYLKTYININLSDLGSGKTTLIEWRYYINSDNIVLNWGLDSYPGEGKEVKSVNFDFFDIKEYEKIKGLDIDNTLSENGNLITKDPFNYKAEENFEDPLKDSIKIDSLLPNYKSSYSGHFSNTIYFDDSKLVRNKCYLVRITITYGDDNNNENKTLRYYYRILYTCDIFNNRYFNTDDFSVLFPDYQPALILNDNKSYIQEKGSSVYEISIDGINYNAFNTAEIYRKEPITENSIFRQSDTLLWNINESYEIQDTKYSGLFNNFELNYAKDDTIDDTIEYLVTLSENAVHTSPENILDLPPIDKNLNATEVDISVQDNLITLSKNIDNLIIYTPFNLKSKQEDVIADYESKLLDINSSKDTVYSCDIKFADKMNIICEGSKLGDDVHDNSVEINMNSIQVLNWFNTFASSEYDIDYIVWKRGDNDGKDYGFIIYPGGKNKSGVINGTIPAYDHERSDGHPRAFGVTNQGEGSKAPDKGDMLMETLVFKSQSFLYFIISKYRSRSGATSTTKITTDTFSNLYKWVKSSKSIPLNKLINLNYYDTYNANLSIEIGDLDCSLISYNIDSLLITDISKYPKNLQLHLNPLKIPNISNYYKIKPEGLKESYYQNYGYKFLFNDNIYFNQNKDCPFKYDGGIEQVASLSISNSSYNVTLNFKIEEEKLIVTKLDGKPREYVYCWCEVKGNTKDWAWTEINQGNGQLIRLNTFYIVK